MYQNRIHRISPNSHPQFFIRRSEIAFDERLPFIESILETLLESRFGPGGVYQSVLRSSDHPDLEPAAFSDMLGDDTKGLSPFYSLPSLGRAENILTHRAQSRQRIDPSVFFVPSVVKISPGRGSPVTN